LKSFKKQSNSVLDNTFNNDYQYQDRFSQLNKSSMSKFKHKTLNNILSPDKWDKIRKQLPESR